MKNLDGPLLGYGLLLFAFDAISILVPTSLREAPVFPSGGEVEDLGLVGLAVDHLVHLVLHALLPVGHHAPDHRDHVCVPIQRGLLALLDSGPGELDLLQELIGGDLDGEPRI